MHELALAKDVLRKILEEASKKGLSKVTAAKVNIGETRITHSEEFHELFNDIIKGTPAEGLKLNVRITPLMAFCNKCSHNFKAREMKNGCPKCSSGDFHIVSGKEVIVEEVL
jgi:hydrogenase nickel incorporation protein HypA/HybF